MSTNNITPERLAVQEQFQKTILGFKFNMYLLTTLPSAWFSGVRVVSLTHNECKTTVPFKWFSQNPFKSTYFACQAMAAELATGLPGMMAVTKRNPDISMLVVGMKGGFTKKAVSLTTFTCAEVDKIRAVVEECIVTGEGKTIEVEVVGHNEKNEEISRFYFTWSFKQKTKK